MVAWQVEWSSFTRRCSPATDSSSNPDWFEYIARKMTDWYKVFPLAPVKAVVDVDVEPEDGEVGSVVDAPAVVTVSSPVGPLVPSECPSALEKAKVTKVVTRSQVFATKTFCLMVKQRRTTFLQQRRARIAWLSPRPPRPPLLLRGPEK
jgi:hypothetical protein